MDSIALNPLQDETSFRQHFLAGLQQISEGETLGAFILALANANQEEGLWQVLLPRLLQRRDELQQHYASQWHASGEPVTGLNPDDLHVFRQVLSLSLEELETTRYRQPGPWILQANPLRSLRPKRMGSQTPISLLLEFNPAGFHFDRPFMDAERYWGGVVEGMELNLFYNKFPFVDGHLLLVPSREAHWPQFHRQEMHHQLWRLCQALGHWQARAGIAYNSIGAYASVNHLHYQMYVRDSQLPIESGQWRHNGGPVDYPLACSVYDEPLQAWAAIDKLHAANQAYNLLYVPGKLYVIPRRRQGEYATAAWSPGFAWYEVCGGFVVEDKQAFTQLQAADITAALSQLAPSPPS